mmetsp:Transcript_24672/g.57055  ORF Transcript_24672/g.57055 Transcript_24672/m.57055 type:complete len:234 (+) Transcript_24672:1412-2113(+)
MLSPCAVKTSTRSAGRREGSSSIPGAWKWSCSRFLTTCRSGLCSKSAPMKISAGAELRRKPALSSNSLVCLSPETRNSAMSSTWWSYVRPSTRQCGRFFECEPKAKRVASFFCVRNSTDVGSSNGRAWLGLPSWCASGLRSCTSAPSIAFTSALHFVPCMASSVFGFSSSLGARLSSARLTRGITLFALGAFFAFFATRADGCDGRVAAARGFFGILLLTRRSAGCGHAEKPS